MNDGILFCPKRPNQAIHLSTFRPEARVGSDPHKVIRTEKAVHEANCTVGRKRPALPTFLPYLQDSTLLVP